MFYYKRTGNKYSDREYKKNIEILTKHYCFKINAEKLLKAYIGFCIGYFTSNWKIKLALVL